MSVILSLQSCMAVGKTTAMRYLQYHAPWAHVLPEDNADVLAQIRGRSLDRTDMAGCIEIQRLWLRAEVERYARAHRFPCCVLDFGAEEFEFFTLNYPRSVGLDWDVEASLTRNWKPCADACRTGSSFWTRRRACCAHGSRVLLPPFEHHLCTLMPLKRAWFAGRSNVDWLDTAL